jgi:hypothetical protein
MIREDWVEQQEHRALIVRPDLGESYLLWLDRGECVVQGLDRSAQLATNNTSAPADKANAGLESTVAGGSTSAVDPVAIEGDVSAAAAPVSSNNLALPDASIDNHPCKVFERRLTLPDGATEVTRTFRATDLSGLAIRTESESNGTLGHLRVVTERREVQANVPQTVFDVPAAFRRKN